jgi:phage-related protein
MDWDEDARDELRQLPAAERRAVMTAVAKLKAFGDRLGAPHSSQVKGSQAGIRELRPRAGRSVWRVLPTAGRSDGDLGCRAGG